MERRLSVLSAAEAGPFRSAFGGEAKMNVIGNQPIGSLA